MLRLSTRLGHDTQLDTKSISHDKNKSSHDIVQGEIDDRTQTLKMKAPPFMQISDKLGVQIVQPSETTLDLANVEIAKPLQNA